MRTIYEDDSILVVSKPAGQTVNKAETTRGVRTLQDELEEYFGIEKSEDGIGGRAGIVHRLDKDTSGVLVIAKTEVVFTDLQAQFKKREIKKEYLALVHGSIDSPQGGSVLLTTGGGVKGKKGRIEAPIGRNPKERMRFGVIEGGRPSVTEYEVISLNPRGLPEETYSYLRVKPKTGRTHQIRVHMKYLGHPLVSDPLYLSRKQLKRDRRWCPRLFLHAESLGFKHPESGAWVRFEADLPEDLRAVLASCRKTPL